MSVNTEPLSRSHNKDKKDGQKKLHDTYSEIVSQTES